MSSAEGRTLTPRSAGPLDGRQKMGKDAMQGGGKRAQNKTMLAGLALAALTVAMPAVAQQPAMPGEALTFDRSRGNCLTCHVIKGGEAAGNVAPELSAMKSRFPDRSELRAIIYDETKRNPQTVMPPFGRNLILSDAEIEAVIDFLYTR
jgi:sulfur-oxidizing protein SoxX